MLFHLTLIFGCQLAGETLVRFLALPLPGPVLGMAILFVGFLVFGLPDDLRRTGEPLLGNLSLLFVPAGVGVMLHGAILSTDWLAISLALVVSTLATVSVTALVMQKLGGDGASSGASSRGGGGSGNEG